MLLPFGTVSIGDDEEKLVTVHRKLSRGVHHQQAIAIAVERNSEVRAAFPDRLAQRAGRQTGRSRR